jgi:hypothetical protein
MRVIEVDASGWKTPLDFMSALQIAIGASCPAAGGLAFGAKHPMQIFSAMRCTYSDLIITSKLAGRL